MGHKPNPAQIKHPYQSTNAPLSRSSPQLTRQNGDGEHNIVIASLPAGHYGITPVAMAAAHMLSSFSSVKFGLMVGIGGERGIRLGDVVVSQPSATVDGFVETGSLNCPPRVLLNAVSALQGKHEIMESEIPRFLDDIQKKYPLMAKPRQGPGYVFQGVENDQLFQADYHHERGNDCRACDAEKQIMREERYTHDPYIFYGTMASGNKVIKDPAEREQLLQTGCLCVETEAAGLMNDFPCLVIRGICDYCDTAYAKELLNTMDVADVTDDTRGTNDHV
ncbi:nucleoside phosphorylase domain-containing protein [Aspergillus germanicus]